MPATKKALSISGSTKPNTLHPGDKRATEKILMPSEVKGCKAFKLRVDARLMTREDFIRNHASGTLRKNERVGMNVDGHYLHERVVFEFGWGFEAIHETRVTWGTPISFPDTKPVTEAGWLIDRYCAMCAFPGDEFATKYIIVEEPDGTRREGLGIVVRKTSAEFVPKKYMVFAIIAEWDKQSSSFKEAVNPC